MQAFYLLACWKDPDDDVSYLHSGYALRILNDLNLDLSDDDDDDDDEGYVVWRRRAWLALFRQDRQQGLFFMRRAALSIDDNEGASFVGDLDSWRKMRNAPKGKKGIALNAVMSARPSRLRAEQVESNMVRPRSGGSSVKLR